MFLLDANVFIEASRRYYALDLAPAFWKALETNGKVGKVLTIDRIEAELNKGKDELDEWVQKNFKNFILHTKDPDLVSVYSEMLGWVMSQTQFNDSAKAEFASVADGWLIAFAKHKNLTLVTHEVFDSNIKRKVPMPNVCQQFGVRHIDTFQMLRDLNVKFN